MDVLLVDDHPILHETLGAVVRSIAPQAQFHTEVDLGGAVTKARQLKDLELVLLDLGLPGCTGIEALVRFLAVLPRARVIVISATEDTASVRAALDAGAVGYLPKTSPPKVMADALRLVHHYSRGIPRIINNLCDKSLLSAFIRESDEVNYWDARRASRDLDRLTD